MRERDGVIGHGVLIRKRNYLFNGVSSVFQVVNSNLRARDVKSDPKYLDTIFFFFFTFSENTDFSLGNVNL